MSSRVFLVLLAFVLIVGQIPKDALASQQSSAVVNIEIIVDASGSMAGETDTGELRIEAARRVLNEVVQAIPSTEGVNVGLRVYGHEGDNTDAGKAESCEASELVVPIDGVATEDLLVQIDGFEPTGWTPLGLSLQEATSDLQDVATDGSTNAVILVTDGIETCEGKPVEAATRALESDAGIVTNVIGFATEAEDEANLTEISEAGGGQLLNANNAGQLISALFTVLEELEVVDEGGNGESREAAIGVGRAGQVGDYDVNVISVTPDATDLVTEENPYNEPPAEGKQFFLARIAVTYTGSESGVPAAELGFNSVGDSNAGYDSLTDRCGLISDDSFQVTDLFDGGSAEFNICWSVDNKDADSLVMYVESYLDFNSEPVWFSLGNSDPVAETTGSDDETEDATPTGSSSSDNDSDESDDSTSGDGDDDAEESEPTDAVDDDEDAPTGNDVGDGSERTSPVAVGETSDVGDYEVTVVSVTSDATDLVMEENPYNEPPAEGGQFFIARIALTYSGSESGYPSAELNFQAVGDTNTGYAIYTDTCGVIPDDGFLVTDLFEGGSAEFNVCWSIDSDDADSLVMYIESNLDFNADPVWFSLED